MPRLDWNRLLDARMGRTLRWVTPLLLLLGLAAGAELTADAGELVPARNVEPLDCLVQPHQLVELGTPTTGVVESVAVERGARVEKGQILLRLESEVERAGVALAKARSRMEGDLRSSEVNLALDQRRVDRKSRLYERRAVSVDDKDHAQVQAELGEIEVTQARENRELARLELARARAALWRRWVHSPFDGVVVDRMVDPGARVSEEPVLKLAQLDPLRIEVIAPAELFGKVQPGAQADVFTELPAGGRYRATVSVVDPMVDAASGRFGMELELPNPEHEIPAGLRCRLQLREDPHGTRTALAAPAGEDSTQDMGDSPR